VARGRPIWDYGRAHRDFLRGLYLEAKPWLAETRQEMAAGAGDYAGLAQRFRSLAPAIPDRAAAAELERLLQHGAAALELNRRYVHAFFAYFEYDEARGQAQRQALDTALTALGEAAAAYRARHQFFQLRGVDVFYDLAGRLLADPDAANRRLREAPDEAQIAEMFRRERERSARWLRQHPQARRLASWQGTVDGADILWIRGGQVVKIEHLAADHLSAAQFRSFTPLPAAPLTVCLKPVQVRGVAHVLEQPSPANDFTLKVYLEDPQPGSAVFQLEFWAETG